MRMPRGPILKTLIAIGMAGGLAILTIFTATAASESQLFGGSPTPERSALTQDVGDENATPTSDSEENGSSIRHRPWVWHGEVHETGQENGALVLGAGACGRWPLIADSEMVEVALMAHFGEPIFVVGVLSAPANEGEHLSIAVGQVVLERSDLADDARLFPGCNRNDPRSAPTPGERADSHVRTPAPAADLLGVLQRFGLSDLRKIPAGERFEHFIGGEANYLDEDGTFVSVQVNGGTAVSATDQVLQFNPNGPADTITIALSEVTMAIRPGGGSASAIEEGDSVIVVVRNGSETVAIVASDRIEVWPGQGSGAPRPDTAPIRPDFGPELSGVL
jgi:hypothetical protein